MASSRHASLVEKESLLVIIPFQFVAAVFEGKSRQGGCVVRVPFSISNLNAL
jgi:hypothetical protein